MALSDYFKQKYLTLRVNYFCREMDRVGMDVIEARGEISRDMGRKFYEGGKGDDSALAKSDVDWFASVNGTAFMFSVFTDLSVRSRKIRSNTPRGVWFAKYLIERCLSGMREEAEKHGHVKNAEYMQEAEDRVNLEGEMSLYYGVGDEELMDHIREANKNAAIVNIPRR